MPVAHSLAIVVVMQAVQAVSENILTSIFQNIPENDVIFTDSLLFEKPARTRVQCTLLCANYERCETFTFTENPMSFGTCRGHSTLLCCKLPCTPKANTRYYKASGLDVNKNGSCLRLQILQPGSGVRELNVTGFSSSVSAYCDQDTDGGGWTVIQRRHNGSVDFNRTMAEYQAGFGDPAGEYWLGLETIYRMTSCQRHEIRFDVQLYNGTTGFAVYMDFFLGPGSDLYSFYCGAKTAGNLYDHLKYQYGMTFSTWDSDTDLWSSNCGAYYGGGWWYKTCFVISVNTRYSTTSACSGNCYICPNWRDFGSHCSNGLQKTAIKIRPL